MGRRRISTRRPRPSATHRAHGAASSPDDDRGAVDSAGSACNQTAHPPRVLLVSLHRRRDRMARSRLVRTGDAIEIVARVRTSELFRRRSSVLVARDWARTPVVRSAVPVLGHLTVRCALRVSHVLRPRDLSPLSARAPRASRPGTCRRTDVDRRHVRLSRPGSRRYDSVAHPQPSHRNKFVFANSTISLAWPLRIAFSM